MTGLPATVFDHIGSDPEASSTALSNPAPWFTQWATGNPGGASGPVVNEHTALNYEMVYSCVSLIAGTIASLPLKVYQQRSDGGRDEVPDRPEYGLLQYEFNPNTSAMTGRETSLGHYLTWGNSYTQIVKNLIGEVFRLQPLGPDLVAPHTNKRGELEYEIKDRATGQVVANLKRDEVLHVPGLSFDAMCGYSTVRIAKHTIRTGMTQDNEAERFVTRGIRPPGAIKMPAGKKFPDDKAAMKWRDSFKRIHSTEEGSLNVMVLEDGWDWVALGISPEAAQFLESRKFTSLEICGIYHVPPHMVGLVEKTTAWGTGIEELTIGFVVYCLLPILRRIEQEYNRKLFKNSPGMFCEHVLSGLLRGDTFKQAQAIQIYMQLGLLSVNESRRMLGWNPAKGGEVRYYPLNFGRVDENGDDIAPAVAETTTPAIAPTSPPAAGLVSALRSGFVDAVGRCLRKEAQSARRAAKKPGEFRAWIDTFYAEHGAMISDSIRWLRDPWPNAQSYPAQHVERSRNELLAVADTKADLSEAVESVVERWTSDRLAELAAGFSLGVPSNAV